MSVSVGENAFVPPDSEMIVKFYRIAQFMKIYWMSWMCFNFWAFFCVVVYFGLALVKSLFLFRFIWYRIFLWTIRYIGNNFNAWTMHKENEKRKKKCSKFLNVMEVAFDHPQLRFFLSAYIIYADTLHIWCDIFAWWRLSIKQHNVT